MDWISARMSNGIPRAPAAARSSAVDAAAAARPTSPAGKRCVRDGPIGQTDPGGGALLRDEEPERREEALHLRRLSVFSTAEPAHIPDVRFRGGHERPSGPSASRFTDRNADATHVDPPTSRADPNSDDWYRSLAWAGASCRTRSEERHRGGVGAPPGHGRPQNRRLGWKLRDRPTCYSTISRGSARNRVPRVTSSSVPGYKNNSCGGDRLPEVTHCTTATEHMSHRGASQSPAGRPQASTCARTESRKPAAALLLDPGPAVRREPRSRRQFLKPVDRQRRSTNLAITTAMNRVRSAIEIEPKHHRTLRS